MARVVSEGRTDFSKIIEENSFYVDKTIFIKDWWKSGKDTTLLTRPRRFGKTLTLNMINRFFSLEYTKQPDPFLGLAIGEEEEMMRLQGTFPVISLTLMGVTGPTYEGMISRLSSLIRNLYYNVKYHYDLKGIRLEHMEYR